MNPPDGDLDPVDPVSAPDPLTPELTERLAAALQAGVSRPPVDAGQLVLAAARRARWLRARRVAGAGAAGLILVASLIGVQARRVDLAGAEAPLAALDGGVRERPTTVAEALESLQAAVRSARPAAGATDVPLRRENMALPSAITTAVPGPSCGPAAAEPTSWTQGWRWSAPADSTPGELPVLSLMLTQWPTEELAARQVRVPAAAAHGCLVLSGRDGTDGPVRLRQGVEELVLLRHGRLVAGVRLPPAPSGGSNEALIAALLPPVQALLRLTARAN